MYSLLYAQTIRAGQDENADRATQSHRNDDQRSGTTSRSRRIVRRAAKTVAVLGVCIAAITGVTISSASAHPAAASQHTNVSARQLQREMHALNSVGFVASSCEVGGTRMTNYSTNQSVLLPW
jgi:hypothetical protein